MLCLLDTDRLRVQMQRYERGLHCYGHSIKEGKKLAKDGIFLLPDARFIPLCCF